MSKSVHSNAADLLNRGWLLAAAVLYLVFVVYGSLVPLDFRARSLESAQAAFANMRYLNLTIGSRADWVANILLFIPLTFLWLGVLWGRGSTIFRLVWTGMVVVCAFALSLSIEFTQLFFPPRTVSQNDIVAETLGALLGVILWWLRGPQTMRWVQALRSNSSAWNWSQQLLYGYLFGLFVYHLLPLDLSLSPVELYRKLKDGRIILVPFGSLPLDRVQAAYNVLTDIALWIPAGFVWQRAVGVPARALRNVFFASLLLEFLQLWVYSRVTDVTDIVTAVLGGCFGIWVAAKWFGSRARDGHRPTTPAGVSRLWVSSTLLWVALLGIVFWYPYNFDIDASFLRERLDGLVRAPFSAYYYGTEFRAVTEVLHKLLFFLPFGALCFSTLRSLWSDIDRGWNYWVAVTLVVAVATVVEGFQLALPDKNADITDWLIEIAGGVIGVAIVNRIYRTGRLSERPPGNGNPVDTIRTVQLVGNRPRWPLGLPAPQGGPWAVVCIWVMVLAVALWIFRGLQFIPYNIREVLGGDNAFFSVLLLSAALVWVCGFPVYAVARCAFNAYPLSRISAAFLLHGIVAWILVAVAAPTESLHDVLGSPVLDWPWQWELFGRFLALFLLWSSASFGAAMLVFRVGEPRLKPLLTLWWATTPFLLGLSYYVVVVHASTDNLTELLAQRASVTAFLWLWAVVLLLAVAAMTLGATVAKGFRQGAWLALMLATVSLPTSYFFLTFALETYIVKYGQVFSAFQFLLSSDRDHYADPIELVARYGIAYLIALMMIAVSAAPFASRFVRSEQTVGLSDTGRPLRQVG